MSARLKTLLTLLALVGAASWFYTHFDRVLERVYVGYHGEARRNPYLAAERLFGRLGSRASEVRTLPELRALSARAALFLPARRGALGALERERLRAWLAGGGRLVVEAEPPGTPDPLLAHYKVSSTAAGARARGSSGSCRPGGAVYVSVPGHKDPLLARLSDTSRLRLPDRGLRWKIDTPAGTQIAALEVGRGELVVATTFGFLHNASIGRNDHAELAWLLAGEGAAREIRMFNHPERRSLLQWLAEHAWPALAAAALLVALALWRAAPRFGPVIPLPEPARRRLLDHLRAAGRHRWTAGHSAALYAAAREACLARLLRTHPDIAGLEAPARARKLGELLGLPADAIARALDATPSGDPGAFARAISMLQSLHARLAAPAHRATEMKR